MTSLLFQERKAVQEEMEKMEAKHRQHDKLKHPMTKDQLEEVWEEQDHMEAKVGGGLCLYFNPCAFGFQQLKGFLWRMQNKPQPRLSVNWWSQAV